MARDANSISEYLDTLRGRMPVEDIRARLAPKPSERKGIRPFTDIRRENVERTWDQLEESASTPSNARPALLDPETRRDLDAYSGNIETLIGTAKVPMGIAGPVRVNGLNAQGEYHVPLATCEAALVASYHRGMRAATAAGGVTAAVLTRGVMRSPGFAFANEISAGLFVDWVLRNRDMLFAAAQATTRHGRLTELSPHIENEVVFLLCRYDTADASGQNMCTIATDALCNAIISHCPVQPEHWFVEANFSSDKKASALAFLSGRGRKTTASVVLEEAIVKRHLRTSIDRMDKYVRMSSLGGIVSGTMGVQGHYANALAAIFIATGQDAACVAECAVGVTRLERSEGSMRFSVTLPNLLVGTVGGGTGTPTARAALDILGLYGAGNADAFAEVVAATCLAGELSIIAALSSGQFTGAHHKLARTRISGEAQ
ncbi:hypothetical protein [Pelagibacterium halotolerans]|uniref:hypothetical protein n=1 Tax=Pelagibacterium halotolerans TaxID=531813 RepID=UPI00384D5F69